MRSKGIDSGVMVCIVDDDAAVRKALSRLVESMGMRAETFASPNEFLNQRRGKSIGCLLLDVQLPGMSGFELHERLLDAGQAAPVIFITAHPDESSRNRAAAADAVAFLEKPFDDRSLLEAIHTAVGQIAGGNDRRT
jgi:FixJ family two-component response regulator